jgi:condensin complex subunit 3
VAAGKMVGAWFDMVQTEGKAIEESKGFVGDDGGIMRGLIQFLEVFDVIGGEAIAVDALLSIFVTRADVLDAFVFDGMSCFNFNNLVALTTCY